MDIGLLKFIYEIELNRWNKSRYNSTNKSGILYESKELILEHYLNKTYLSNLYNTILQGSYIQEYSNLSISEYLPKNLKVRKKLLECDVSNLIIFNIPFDQSYIEQSVNVINKQINLNSYYQEFKNRIITLLSNKQHRALFVSFENNSLVSFMFINAFESSLDDFRHEFIHYYQWCSGDDLIDLNEEIELPDNIELITNKKISKNYINTLINKKDILPYINELIEQLQEYGMNRDEFKKYFKQDNKGKLVWNIEDDKGYIERLSKSEFFIWLKNNNLNLIPLLVFVIIQLYDINEAEIKTTIFSQLF